jgi:putative hydrolases of HD superfamily
MADDRFGQQIAFILEIDKLKQVLRRTLLLAGRRENSAEHSWHLATMVSVLAEYANEKVDVTRVTQMALVHDIVEIDAGDVFAYDEAAYAQKAVREQQAAERIFNLLPSDQARWVRGLWDEFEEQQTAESRFANALDRLQPILLNYAKQGEMWRQHGVTAARVLARNRVIAAGSQRLWEHVQSLVAEALRKGFLVND